MRAIKKVSEIKKAREESFWKARYVCRRDDGETEGVGLSQLADGGG